MKLTDPTLSLPFILINRLGLIPAIFVFPLKPQRARWTFPARGQVQQTMTANFLDDFSGPRAVLAQLHLQGTFGYDPRVGGAFGVAVHGSVHLKALEEIFEVFNALDRQLKKDGGAVQEYLGIARLHAWRVWVKELSYEIRSTDPLLYYYSLTLLRLKDYLSPVGPSLPPGLPSLSSIGSTLGGLF